jgi:serine/threonine protein kinase
MARATLQLKLSKGDLIGGKFAVLKKLGEGGCGSVYRCKPVKDGDPDVAVKVLENASDLARFKREAKVLGSIRNPNVVKLIERGNHEGHPYLVLEYAEGGSLRDLMDAQGKLPAEEAAWALVQAVRGLRASKTVHRDLKPENLLLGRGANASSRAPALVVGDAKKGAVVMVADFGLAKQRDPTATRLTNTGQVMGTPVYMSPEQCRNTRTVNERSDIYSLGVIFYEMVVGRAPFDANNAYDIMAKHCNDEPKFPRMDPRVKKVCEKCLSKSPKDRYLSLYALETDLRGIAGLGEADKDTASVAWIVILVGLAILAGLGWVMRDQLHDLLLPYWRNFTR